MDLLKIENIYYYKTFFMRKSSIFISVVVVVLIFNELLCVLMSGRVYFFGLN
jgi:hypothetical protein